MKRSEPQWKRQLAKKLLADQRIWDKLKHKELDWTGNARFDSGSFFAPYMPLIVSKGYTYEP